MNIFFLSRSPGQSARLMCDQHVVKMITETAQLLSTWHFWSVSKSIEHVKSISKETAHAIGMYKPTHINHPCNIWLRKSDSNAAWLLLHGLGLGEEFKYRRKKKHKSSYVIEHLYNYHIDYLDFTGLSGMTDPPQCMPEQYQDADTVQAYRKYYCGEKAEFATWRWGRSAPEWFKPL